MHRARKDAGHEAAWARVRPDPAAPDVLRSRHRALRRLRRLGSAAPTFRPRDDERPARDASRTRRGLGSTDEIEAAEPDELSAVEQEDLPQEHSLVDLLAQIGWPPQVQGAAIAVERIVLPPSAQADLPEDDDAALAAVADHPERQDVRILVAVLRDGTSTCLLRQRSNDSDDRVAVGQDIAPGLVAALAETLRD